MVYDVNVALPCVLEELRAGNFIVPNIYQVATRLQGLEGLSCNLITNMYIHDENLNVIGKVNLSRPIVRKENDKYVFKFKLDY